MRHKSLVTALDLEQWADSIESRFLLPQLVRRLIYATTQSIQHMSFPSREQTHRPGWDGILLTGSGNAFVPEGVSGWELGTGNTPASKAESDYQTRGAEPEGLHPVKTTFVFVTPRKWVNGRNWILEKRASGTWKDVRVYDSSELEAWLELAPGVDRWLGEQMEIVFSGTRSIGTY